MIVLKCEWCDKAFEVPFSKRKRSFCSKSCSASRPKAERQRRITLSCTGCGVEVTRRHSEVAVSGRVYCTSECFKESGGHSLPRPRARKPVGSTKLDSYGYVHERTETGWIAQHRLAMQRILGRDLLPGENVHHKNGRRADNRPENLELWVTSQPKGQRVGDVVAWAHEVLDRYALVAEGAM